MAVLNPVLKRNNYTVPVCHVLELTYTYHIGLCNLTAAQRVVQLRRRLL